MIRWGEGGAYTLHFLGALTDEPVLSKIAKKVGVSFNILAGGVQNVGDQHIGTMICDIMGSAEQVAEALQQLKNEGISIEEEKI
jgi:D-methionine transport system ATP-binding protein